MKKLRVYDIEWDTDGEVVEGLPEEVILNENELPDGVIDSIEEEPYSDGLDIITDYLSDKVGFCICGYCIEIIKEDEEKLEKDPVLCGFVWCHGNKDFEAFEVNLKKQDRDTIEAILSKYDTSGTSVRNVWDSKFSDVFSEIY